MQQGEVLGIIGRNGAGKSTLLKILSRVTAPTSGQVKVKGRIASLLEVGTGFHPELTGRENIFLNGAILGMTRQEVLRKFDEIVSFAEVEKFVDTPVKRYSSGMYVRLAFAVAAHLESEILLVDEVLAVGDAEFQKKCLGKMGDVASNEGRTVFFVSHNMDSIRNLCVSSLLLENGEINSLGETDNIINYYLNKYHKDNNDLKLSKIDCSLLEHSGSGEAKIIWAEVKNSKNVNTLQLFMFDDLYIKFGVQNPYNFSLDYAIEISDQNGYPLIHVWTGFTEQEKNRRYDKNDQIIIQVKIPNIDLYPDYYNVNLWVGNHTRRIDKIENCFTIKIIKNNDIRQDLLISRGRLFKKGEWRIF